MFRSFLFFLLSSCVAQASRADWTASVHATGFVRGEASAFAPTSDGGVVVAGGYDAQVIARFTADGTRLWQHSGLGRLAASRALSLVVTSDGDVVAVSQVAQAPASSIQAQVARLAADGSVLWTDGFGPGQVEASAGPGHSTYVAWVSNGNVNIEARNAAGAQQWLWRTAQPAFPSLGLVGLRAVAGGRALACLAGGGSVYLVELAPDGTQTWLAQEAGNGARCEVAANGAILVLLDATSSSPATLVQYDAAHQRAWARVLPETGWQVEHLRASPDGGAWLASRVVPSAGAQVVERIRRVASDSSFAWVVDVPMYASNGTLIQFDAFTVVPDGRVTLSGWSYPYMVLADVAPSGALGLRRELVNPDFGSVTLGVGASDGALYVRNRYAGSASAAGDTRMSFLRLSATTREVEWAGYEQPGEVPTTTCDDCLALAGDGSVRIVATSAAGTVAEPTSMLHLAAFDAAGAPRWQREFASVWPASRIAFAANGTAFVLGSVTGAPAMLHVVDANGNLIVARQLDYQVLSATRAGDDVLFAGFGDDGTAVVERFDGQAQSVWQHREPNAVTWGFLRASFDPATGNTLLAGNRGTTPTEYVAFAARLGPDGQRLGEIPLSPSFLDNLASSADGSLVASFQSGLGCRLSGFTAMGFLAWQQPQNSCLQLIDGPRSGYGFLSNSTVGWLDTDGNELWYGWQFGPWREAVVSSGRLIALRLTPGWQPGVVAAYDIASGRLIGSIEPPQVAADAATAGLVATSGRVAVSGYAQQPDGIPRARVTVFESLVPLFADEFD